MCVGLEPVFEPDIKKGGGGSEIQEKGKPSVTFRGKIIINIFNQYCTAMVDT